MTALENFPKILTIAPDETDTLNSDKELNWCFIVPNVHLKLVEEYSIDVRGSQTCPNETFSYTDTMYLPVCENMLIYTTPDGHCKFKNLTTNPYLVQLECHCPMTQPTITVTVVRPSPSVTSLPLPDFCSEQFNDYYTNQTLNQEPKLSQDYLDSCCNSTSSEAHSKSLLSLFTSFIVAMAIQTLVGT